MAAISVVQTFIQPPLALSAGVGPRSVNACSVLTFAVATRSFGVQVLLGNAWGFHRSQSKQTNKQSPTNCLGFYSLIPFDSSGFVLF